MAARRLVAFCLLLCLVSLSLTACKGKSGGTSQSAGLTSVEAAELVWPEAKKNFGDAVLWRMAPVDEGNSLTMRLASDWQNSDHSAAWFIWYADPVGENWMMFSVQDKAIASRDIGTRSFSKMAMDAEWPRERPAVAMKDAAKAVAAQGAEFSALTWTEFTYEYDSDSHKRPGWVFSFSETLSSGGTLIYWFFVDGITGVVLRAVNDRNEDMVLPIDREALLKPRTENHEKDLRQFFGFISTEQPEWAVRQLASSASPNEATAQMWLANFQSLSALTVVSVEQVSLDQWTAEHEFYKVKLNVKTSDPPEKYGWDNGVNLRWVELIPQGAGAWKVAALATNP
ncbi:MAG: hypothetical protein NTX94_06250, partial [Caldiserica bacterium]|nr:hypothetical protein [Caldisericota bacterium]